MELTVRGTIIGYIFFVAAPFGMLTCGSAHSFSGLLPGVDKNSMFYPQGIKYFGKYSHLLQGVQDKIPSLVLPKAIALKDCVVIHRFLVALNIAIIVELQLPAFQSHEPSAIDLTDCDKNGLMRP